MLGDDLYDDSFSIDSPAGEFLGEFGVGVSDTLPGGSSKRVTAFEVWLFDKNDIQTTTTVLLSSYAYNDPATRARLEPKGNVALAEPGKQYVFETTTLRGVVTIVDMQYASGGSLLPSSESYFERASFELAIWQKNNAAASGSAYK